MSGECELALSECVAVLVMSVQTRAQLAAAPWWVQMRESGGVGAWPRGKGSGAITMGEVEVLAATGGRGPACALLET